ncbi:MAG: DUF1415 domain-containing protein [Bacteriovoracaceae bacterium]|nr:DUF1415 domain-containing protein [Bacteriovoracaceae bacterium]
MNTASKLKNWLEKTIIELNLCPFARAPYDQGRLHLVESKADSLFLAQKVFLDEVEFLFNTDEEVLSTTVIGFTQWKIAFNDFYQFTLSMESLLQEAKLDSLFQIVAFHPDFRLAGFEDSSYAHWANSSPMPVLHLLRSNEVKHATEKISGEEVSKFNEIRISKLSDVERRKYFPWKVS